MRPLIDLPNLDGFQFLGITPDGAAIPCTVRRDPATGLHSIEGAMYAELAGWIQNYKSMVKGVR